MRRRQFFAPTSSASESGNKRVARVAQITDSESTRLQMFWEFEASRKENAFAFHSAMAQPGEAGYLGFEDSENGDFDQDADWLGK